MRVIEGEKTLRVFRCRSNAYSPSGPFPCGRLTERWPHLTIPSYLYAAAQPCLDLRKGEFWCPYICSPGTGLRARTA